MKRVLMFGILLLSIFISLVFIRLWELSRR